MEIIDIVSLDLSQLNKSASESEKTLKDLKEEIKTLKKSLDGAAIGSEDFKKNLDALTKAQNDLKAATKTVTKDVAGSYNALTKEMSELKKVWKATGDEAIRSKLGERIEEINTELKELDETIGNSQRNVGNYKSALDGISEIDFDKSIEAGEELATNFGHVTRVVGGLVGSFELIEGSLTLLGVQSEDFEKTMVKIQSLMLIGNSLSAIGDSVESFAKLNKAVKSSEKYINLMAKAEKIFTSSVEANTTAQKANMVAISGVKTALASLGITAAIGGLIALATNWEKVAAAIGLAKDKVNDYSKSAERAQKAKNNIFTYGEEQIRDFELGAKLRSAQGESEESILQSRKEVYLKVLSQTREKLNAVIREYNAAIVTYNSGASGIDREKLKENIDALEEVKNELNDKYKDLAFAIKEFNVDLKIIDINTGKEIAESKKELARIAAEEKTRMETFLEESINNSLSEISDEKIESVDDTPLDLTSVNLNEELRKGPDSRYNAGMARVTDIYNKSVTQMATADTNGDYLTSMKLHLEILKEQAQVTRDYIDDLSLLPGTENEVLEKETELAENRAEQIATIRAMKDVLHDQVGEQLDEFGAGIDRILAAGMGLTDVWGNAFKAIVQGSKEANESIREGGKGFETYGKVASSALGAVGSVLSAVASDQDNATREGFEKQKKFAIASTTMSTLAGVMNSAASIWSIFNAPETAIGQAIMEAVTAASLIALGAVQVRKIKQTKFDGGGDVLSGGNIGNAPTINAKEALNSQVDSLSSVIKGASERGDIKDQRVYVLESDITNTQNNVKTTVKEATF